ncbi:hypothetical protein E3T23_00255 [Cryobacterium cheniae]|uniref:Pyrrolo-quinoline quinone n=1 Tax=Cryobacterium cheniae TaxID=1259262 RepID=A0A4R8Y178_9MICO|nr:PQQ-binding-like beta-propeller repeat protein [Cryobacterium cheniae]TFC84279.1 hypothetical protein E3T23_00255 [Cryobacterium cheniae]
MRARYTTTCCAFVILGATLTGCTPTADTLGARTVRPESIIFDTDETPRRIAPGLTAAGTLESDRAPIAADGAFVSMIFPDGEREQLSFVGATSTGTRWQIDTNPSCVGSALTRAGEEELIVVLDSDARLAGGRVAMRTVATAFRADTGAHVWGPVDVPGPIQGPGLIFADTPKAIVSAAPTSRVMLSAHDGSVVADETRSDDVQIDYESNGVGLVRIAGELRALDTRTSSTLWDSVSLARPDGTDSTWSASVDETAGASRGTMVVLRWAAPDGAQVVAAHDVRTGRVLGSLPEARDMVTVSSPSGSHIVVASPAPGATILTAIDPVEGLLWARHITGTVTLESASDATLYLRNDAQGVALNLASGLEHARGDFAVPLAILADGTAILPTGDQSRYLLTTTTPKDRR